MKLPLFAHVVRFSPTVSPRTLRTLASSMVSLAFVLAAKSGWLEGVPW
ncbi:MAG: hypothetical protein ABL998_14110 [Planctomycetota bacterium]